MKFKSLCAGALGVLLFFVGQSISAIGGYDVYDESPPATPAPNRGRSTPAPDQKSPTLPPPDREASKLPDPDPKAVLPAPNPGKSSLPAPDPEKSVLAPAWRGHSTPDLPGESSPPSLASLPPATKGPPPAAGTGGQTAPAVGTGGQTAPAVSRSPALPGGGSPAPPGTAPVAQGLFLGAIAGLRAPNYNTDNTDWKTVNIEGKSTANGGLFIGMDLGSLILQAEVLLGGDSAAIENMPATMEIDDISGFSLLIPLIFKWNFHLGPLVLQPLAGPYLNFALGNLKIGGRMGGEEPYANPPLGFMFGGDVGFPLWQGLVFLDLRFAVDFGKTAAGNNPMTAWTRSAFMLNLGYQFFVGGRT